MFFNINDQNNPGKDAIFSNFSTSHKHSSGNPLVPLMLQLTDGKAMWQEKALKMPPTTTSRAIHKQNVGKNILRT